MKEDSEGHPECGPSARMLGVRLEGDIPIADTGEVQPETGGMSVAVDDPQHLPRHRRPPEHGATAATPFGT